MANPQQLPHSVEAEESLLGAVLINPAAFAQISGLVSASDFYIHRHGWVWQAFEALDAKSQNIDFVTVTNILEDRGQLAEVGGSATITGWLSTPSAMHADSYANIVRSHAVRRQRIEIANQIALSAYNDDADVDIMAIARSLMNESASGRSSHPLNADKLLARLQDRRENPSEVWGIPTPWKMINRLTGGLHTGKSTFIKGESGIGKTIMLLNMAFHAAEQGYNVILYELEMSEEDLQQRQVSIATGITEFKMNRGMTTDEEFAQIAAELARFEQLTLMICDLPGWTSQDIRADVARKQAEGFHADLVLVDYVGLMGDKSDSPWELVEKAAKGLRAAAKELGFHALSVASETKDGSMKGTAEVRYNADQIWSFTQPFPRDEPQTRRVGFDKARHGGAVDEASQMSRMYVDLLLDKRLPVLRDLTRQQTNIQSTMENQGHRNYANGGE